MEIRERGFPGLGGEVVIMWWLSYYSARRYSLYG